MKRPEAFSYKKSTDAIVRLILMPCLPGGPREMNDWRVPDPFCGTSAI
ncbi:MAG TPA: hypothetical protein PLM60_02280 [Methanoregulaceae archaeon]|nr:hypothetical protein [Burkholderiaceae bacterium]NLH25734.1 hypothetical protein [Methanomicrobiales archaeon]HPS22220.1 hypothetical protein [Methanoregulaceae archaeon]